MSACILVSGDIGRSPRMQYHAVALDHTLDNKISIIGHDESDCIPEIQFLRKTEKAAVLNSKSSFGILGEFFKLTWFLAFCVSPKIIIAQNTPSIPTLSVLVFLYPLLMLRKTMIIIDWHNLSYTIAEKKSKSSFVIGGLRLTEFISSKLFPKHFCVSKTMQVWLKYNWNLDAIYLPDYPFDSFSNKICNHEILSQFSSCSDMNSESRPIFCLTATSWTCDERFDLLWDALLLLDEKFTDGEMHFCVFITGKGPMRSAFESKINSWPFRHIQVLTTWLEYKDYCSLVGSVDVGISLHDSTSGLDLPMKIVDMLGAKTPVIAKNYVCISELVHKSNGTLFENAEDLADILYSTPLSVWKHMRTNMQPLPSFTDNWCDVWTQHFT